MQVVAAFAVPILALEEVLKVFSRRRGRSEGASNGRSGGGEDEGRAGAGEAGDGRLEGGMEQQQQQLPVADNNFPRVPRMLRSARRSKRQEEEGA